MLSEILLYYMDMIYSAIRNIAVLYGYIIYNINLYIKYPLFLSDFNTTRFFSTDFGKKSLILNFIKIRAVGAELLHMDRGTDG